MSDSQILNFVHCRSCFKLKPFHIKPKDWARFEVGWTRQGFQVRCIRCDKNVLHIDFCNQKVGFVRDDGSTEERKPDETNH